MKILKSIFFCALLITAAACSDDDEDVIADTNLVAGVWDLQSIEYSGESSTTIENETIIQTYTGSGINIDATMTFSENPNEVFTEGSYDIVLTTTVNGETIEQTVGSEQAGLNAAGSDVSTWSINGDEMTFTTNGESQVYDIVTLNQNTMVLNYNDVVEVSQQGITTTSAIDATIALTR